MKSYLRLIAAGLALLTAPAVAQNAIPTLGNPGSLAGGIALANGSASGAYATILNPSATAAYNFNLPATAGTSGYLYTSGGGGAAPATWTSPTVTINSIPCSLGGTCTISTGTSLVNNVSTITGGTAGYILQDNGTTITELPTIGTGSVMLGTVVASTVNSAFEAGAGPSGGPGVENAGWGPGTLSKILNAPTNTISSASWTSNVLTFNTATPHGVSVGQPFFVSGFSNGYLDQEFIAISGTSGTTLNATLGFNPGTITGGGVLNTPGGANVAFGPLNMVYETFGGENTALGVHVLKECVGCNNNTGVGTDVLYSATYAQNNTCIGHFTCFDLTTASSATAVGSGALSSLTTGAQNSASGFGALFSLTTGGENTAYGYQTLNSSTTDSRNIAIGTNAGFSVNGGSDNVLIGYLGGYSMSTGGENIIIGSQPDTYAAITSGTQNIMIGYDVAVPTATANGQIDIGNLIYGTGATGTQSTISSGNIGIANKAPSYRLDVGTSADTGITFQLTNSSGSCTHSAGVSSETVSCSSDKRLKANIVDAESALPSIDLYKVRRFTVKSTGESKIGVIAQEVIKTLPDDVHMGKNGFYTVDQPNVWQIVKAIQELKADNDNMRSKIIRLERKRPRTIFRKTLHRARK